MNNIIVDSRACGVGKTNPERNSIRHDLNLAYLNDERSIVVLPTIKLVRQYEQFLEKDLVHPGEWAAITSEHYSNTVDQVMDAVLDLSKRIILVTQITWKRCQWLSGIKKQFHLFIDEAIEPWDQIKIWDNSSGIDWNWYQHIDCEYQPGAEYQTFKFNQAFSDSSITSDSEIARKLCEPNQTLWIKTSDYDCLKNNDTPSRFSVLIEVDPEIVEGWLSVRIASAAFDVTFMRYWLDKYSINWFTPEQLKFQPHTSKLTVHSPLDHSASGIQWSLNKQRQQAPLDQDLKSHIIQKEVTDTILVLSNKSYQKRNKYSSRQVDGVFKSHGLNNWSHIQHVVVDAATNVDPDLVHWLVNECGMWKRKSYDPIYTARTSYDIYQFLMRSAARQQPALPVDFYVVDIRITLDLMEFFWDTKLVSNEYYETPLYTAWDLQKKSDEMKKRRSKKTPLTGSERKQVCIFRKKYPDLCKGLDSREILDLVEKQK